MRIRQSALWLLLVLAEMGCGPTVVYAQTVPATLTVTWSPNAPSENVTSYDVTLDNGAVIVVPATSPLAAQLTVTAYGHHVASVTAKSVTLACDDPTQCNSVNVTSSAPATAGFTLSPPPSKPQISKITKP